MRIDESFLLAEYDKAFDMIINIDNRRGTFMRYYSALYTAIAGLVGALFLGHPAPTLSQTIAVSVLLVIGTVAGLTTLHILRSERASNIRYRRKINLIREILMTKSPNKRRYLSKANRDIGIKVYTKREQDQPKGIGSTLKGILPALITMTASQVGLLGVVWPVFLGWLK